MITESDIKALRTGSSRFYRVIVLTVFPFGIAVVLAGGVINFVLSARYAEIAGVTMREVVDLSSHGFLVSEQYGGALVMAVDRFETGMVLIALDVLYVAMMVGAWNRYRRDTRILTFIEEKRG